VPAHPPRPRTDRVGSKARDIFAAIRAQDVLLHHPYDSFSTSVQAFIEQAAADPRVLAIKQTLYRTQRRQPDHRRPHRRAEAGKQVLAVVEIKARFDEQNNISWARKLEHAGVHVVYGIVGLKTHCKLSLVVRQEADGLRRYCHIGTGNYNPKTARSTRTSACSPATRRSAKTSPGCSTSSPASRRAEVQAPARRPAHGPLGLIDLIDAEIARQRRARRGRASASR
jgi:polyphosphate kinase